MNAFSKNKCVSEFTSQLFCSFFPVYIRIIIFSPPLSLRPFQVNEKEHFCVKYLNVLKIIFFFITEYNNNKNLFRKNSITHNEKKMDPTLSVYMAN